MSGPSITLRFVVAVLVVVTVVPVGVASVGGDDRPAADPTAGCFPEAGDPIVVGQEGPRMTLSVHTSLFRVLAEPGGVGLSAVGATERYRIVTLRAGVVFEGVGDPVAFVTDPFDRFHTVFEYTLSLPMLSAAPGPETYEQDEPFVRGPVPTAGCGPNRSGPSES